MIGSKLGIYSQGGLAPFAFGNALDFDGVNDYVQLNSGVLIDTTTEWTFSMWINPTKTNVSLGGENTNANGLFYLINSTLLRVQFLGGSAALSRLNFTIPTVTLNQWHHLCVTKDSSNDVRVYWDGVQSVTGALPTNDSMTISQLGSYRRSSLYFGGKMDEFGIDKTFAATLSEVGQLYNGGDGNSFINIFPTAVVSYPFNENSPASTAVDSSGNGNNGALTNFDTATCWVAH